MHTAFPFRHMYFASLSFHMQHTSSLLTLSPRTLSHPHSSHSLTHSHPHSHSLPTHSYPHSSHSLLTHSYPHPYPIIPSHHILTSSPLSHHPLPYSSPPLLIRLLFRPSSPPLLISSPPPLLIPSQDAPFNPSMFGTTLEDVMELQSAKFPDHTLPWVIEALTDAVLKLNGPQTEGIFRYHSTVIVTSTVKPPTVDWEIFTLKIIRIKNMLYFHGLFDPRKSFLTGVQYGQAPGTFRAFSLLPGIWL